MTPTRRAVAGLFVSFVLVVSYAAAQVAPLPNDPAEMVTGDAHVVSKRDQRAAAIDLISQARSNFALHSSDGSPYIMKISFSSHGPLQQEGDGTMEESWADGDHWRWTASFAGSTQTRIGNSGRIYGNTDPIPMRVQMVRSALFWPIAMSGVQAMIRSAPRKVGDEEVNCLLLSGGVPAEPAPRYWVETEYCINSKNGLLVMASRAPGIYIDYDYENAINFHGHIIPRSITVSEDRNLVLEIHVDNLSDAADLDAKLFEPTPEMIANPTFTLATSSRFPIPVDPYPGTPTDIQPVIVHATLGDEFGEVLEAEALQTSDRKLAQAAIDVVVNTPFEPTGMQREVFVNVQFHRPQAIGISIFLERVHRVVLVRRRPPTMQRPHWPRKPVPPGNTMEGGGGDHF